jgi:aromatic ring-cleaving dioxygenase
MGQAMTRKRRKTRSRQERRRVHARTRQTRAQAVTRHVEALYEYAFAAFDKPHPLVEWAKKHTGPLATHNRWL